MAGYLRLPQAVNCPPLVILSPGLESAKEEFYHWENVFLKRGMATLSLEGPRGRRAGLRHPDAGSRQYLRLELLHA